jgi:hypothetical protein
MAKVRKGIVSPYLKRLLQRLQWRRDIISREQKKKPYEDRVRDNVYDTALREADEIVTILKNDPQYWKEMEMRKWGEVK